MGDERFETGRAVRREVLGEAHVARSEAGADAFDAPFVRFITETAWGAVWGRDGLSRRERSLITLAILASLGREEELKLHLAASSRTETSAEDVREMLFHVAAYAGIPAANTAFRHARAALQADGRLPPEAP